MKITDRITRAIIERYSDCICLPCYYNGGYESDVLARRESGRVIEFEVKVSRSDFFADFKKGDRHSLLSRGAAMANQFYFVVPAGMVSADECPTHAGLFYLHILKGISVLDKLPYEHNTLREVKSAPLLHKDKRLPLDLVAKSCHTREFHLRNKLRKFDDARRAFAANDRESKKMSEQIKALEIRLLKYEHPRQFEIHKQKDVYKKYFPEDLEKSPAPPDI